MKREGLIGAAIALAFFVACLALVKTEPESWNDQARVATIESLVERGTLVIDESGWSELTGDKIFLDGKFYSDKFPMLSLIGAGVYAVLHAFGGSLAPNCTQTGEFCAYRPLTLIVIAVPAALMLLLFFTYALQQHVEVWAAAVGTLALGFATMIFPYSMVINHHVPAAVCVFTGFFLLAQRAWYDRARLFGAGLCISLAVMIDPVAGIPAAGVFFIALARERSRIALLAAGAAIPVVMTAWLNTHVTGSMVPAYFLTYGYAYEGSALPQTIAGLGTPDDYIRYAFRMFLGGQGLFAFNPTLIFPLFIAIRLTFTRDHPLRLEAALTGLAFALLSLYLAVGTGSFGGNAYGERWFVPAIPTLFSFVFFGAPLNATGWKRGLWIPFVFFLALALISSIQGAWLPWGVTLPPLQMTRQDTFPIFGFKWNFLLR
jgi:hypothetical protein